MIKYKAFYKYLGTTLNIYFKCKSKDIDDSYSTLFVLDYVNHIWDNRRSIDLDNITNSFYRINIYADISDNDVYKGSLTKEGKLSIEKSKSLDLDINK